jgi:hypothetical protein
MTFSSRPSWRYALLTLGFAFLGLALKDPQGLAQRRHVPNHATVGIGQRISFLHDGRTSDLLTGITAHSSAAGGGDDHHDGGHPESEATAVIRKFDDLSRADKQAILDFLRSL